MRISAHVKAHNKGGNTRGQESKGFTDCHEERSGESKDTVDQGQNRYGEVDGVVEGVEGVGEEKRRRRGGEERCVPR